MGYLLRTEPMTRAECKERSADNFIEEVIPVDLSDIIENDFVGFLDILEHKLLSDQGILEDVNYEVVGSGLNDQVHLKVTGYAQLVGEDY